MLLQADIFSQKADGKTFLIAGLGIIGALLAFVLFIFLVRTCFSIERNTKKSAHTLIKTLMIALAPSVYTILALLNIEVTIPFSIFIIISVVMFIIVAIWNIKSFGILGGIFFSIMHGVFGALACIGVGMLVFVGIFLIIAVFFGGSSSPAGGGSSSPSSVRNIRTGQVYTVSSGTNGNLYLAGTSCVLYPDPDYQGKYYDDQGNDYEPA